MKSPQVMLRYSNCQALFITDGQIVESTINKTQTNFIHVDFTEQDKQQTMANTFSDKLLIQ